MAKNYKGQKNDARRSGKDQNHTNRRRKTNSPNNVKSEGVHNCNALSSLNDISWYSKYPDILSAAANVPFANRPGSVINVSGTDVTIPGICVIQWAPSIGYSNSAVSPASTTARELYARVRSAFSGELPENGPDILMYMLALDSVFAYIGHLKRIYRTLNSYSIYNYNVPDTLLNSLGLTDAQIQELRSNLPQFNSIINQLIYMASKFKCPSTFDLFNRHYWMNDNVYTDDATVASQLYVFRMMGVYKWDGSGSTGTSLVYTPLPSTAASGKTFAQTLFDFGTSLLDALTSDDDALTISGHLVRAFDGVAQWAPDNIGFDERLTPVYVPEVLPQIENAFASGIGLNNANSSLNITQDPTTNTIKYTPVTSYVTSGGKPNYLDRAVLNLRPLQPTAQDVTIATRLSSYVDYNGEVFATRDSDGSTFCAVICGTELVGAIVLYNGKRQINYSSFYSFTYSTSTATPAAQVVTMMVQVEAIALLESFDWHPLTVLRLNMASPTSTQQLLVTDIKNLAQPTMKDLYEIHKVCSYSELNSFNVINF